MRVLSPALFPGEPSLQASLIAGALRSLLVVKKPLASCGLNVFRCQPSSRDANGLFDFLIRSTRDRAFYAPSGGLAGGLNTQGPRPVPPAQKRCRLSSHLPSLNNQHRTDEVLIPERGQVRVALLLWAGLGPSPGLSRREPILSAKDRRSREWGDARDAERCLSPRSSGRSGRVLSARRSETVTKSCERSGIPERGPGPHP